MARASIAQADTVVENILRLIEGRQDLSIYKPNVGFECAIKLALGKVRPRSMIG